MLSNFRVFFFFFCAGNYPSLFSFLVRAKLRKTLYKFGKRTDVRLVFHNMKYKKHPYDFRHEEHFTCLLLVSRGCYVITNFVFTTITCPAIYIFYNTVHNFYFHKYSTYVNRLKIKIIHSV